MRVPRTIRNAFSKTVENLEEEHTCSPLEDKTCQIFIVGLSETGADRVCSLYTEIGLLAKYGYQGCRACERDALCKLLAGKSTYSVYDTCECSGGVAWVHWEQLAEKYKKAKFILTERPGRDWAKVIMGQGRSQAAQYRRCVHRKLDFQVAAYLKVYGRILHDWEWLENLCAEHNFDVRSYFRPEPYRFLAVNVFAEKEEDLKEKLSSFVGL